MQDKIIFIIPGFRQQPTSKAYTNLAALLKEDGYTPYLVKIYWKNSTISKNTEYFLKQFEKVKAKKKYILGFSYGAMIALLASTKVKTNGVILCSLSPYFKEDVSKVNTKALSALGKLRYDDFSRLKLSKLAPKIKTKQVVIMYGTAESRSLIRRATHAFSKIKTPKKYLLPVLKTEHDIGSARYLETIELAARGLL